MKTIMRRVLPGLLLLGCLIQPVLGQQNKVGTIDLRKVFDNYYKRQQAEAALKEHGSELDKENKAYFDDYNKTKEDYGKLVAAANDQTLSSQEREKRKTEADAKLADLKSSENTIRTFQDNAREQLDTQKKRMRDTILGEIRSAIAAKAKAAGYTMVIDIASESMNSTPVVLYTNGENDITDAILTQLNAGAPPPTDTPKVPETKGDKKDDKR
jgi:outer membrane protein